MATRVPDPSLYRQLGGRVALEAVVDDFYHRVLDDAALAPFFAGTDMDGLRRHQVAFLSAALGGPATYDGRALRQAHAGRGITERHFAAVAGHLAAALRACGVRDATADVIIDQVAGLRDEVVVP